MNKQEAVAKLKTESLEVEPGREFEVRRIEPEDAWGVARCFYVAYGEHYPFDTYYIPDKLIDENRKGNIISVVARTGSGDIVGCCALYRSSAYFSGVYEIGQAIVVPEYRFTFAALCMQEFLMELLDSLQEIHAIFGEAVCNHVITQKMMTFAGFEETGLELGLMPPEAFTDLVFPFDRVSTVLGFRTVKDRSHDIFVPKNYVRELEFTMSGIDISRTLKESRKRPPRGVLTGFVPLFIDYAHVVRSNVYRIGEDFPEVQDGLEREAQSRQAQVTQIFVNLGDPCSDWAVSLLRKGGYFFGGFLPRWFDTDGLLMQRLAVLPHPQGIKLSSSRARKILEIIRHDIERNPACRYLLDQ